MELLSEEPPINLYDEPWRIFSRNPNDPPHFVDEGARVVNSLVCEGCRIYGTVENSVLSPGVIVGKGATVSGSIVMDGTNIGEGAKVRMSIIDEEVTIGKGAVIGAEDDPSRAEKKIVVLARGVEIAPGDSVPAGKEVRHDS